MNSNPKWIRLTFDKPKVIRVARWIWTQIHCESWSGSDNRIAPWYTIRNVWCLVSGKRRAYRFKWFCGKCDYVNYGPPSSARTNDRVEESRMWADAQHDGRPAEYRWRPLLNAAKFGWRPLLECHAVTLPMQENAKLGRILYLGECR